MNPAKDPSRELLNREISSRIRNALEIKDWNKIEFWARKWIQMDPSNSEGFKWLARSSLAQNNLRMAGYAYSRLLDFDSHNNEAIKFFEDFPSFSLADQMAPEALQVPEKTQKSSPIPSSGPNAFHLEPELRRKLSVKFYELASLFEEAKQPANAAQHYLSSFEMQASQMAGLSAARSLHAENKSSEALKFLRAQCENFPSWIEGRMLLGRIYFEIGQRAEAQKQFQMVLKLEPQHKQALQSLRQLIIPSV